MADHKYQFHRKARRTFLMAHFCITMNFIKNIIINRGYQTNCIHFWIVLVTDDFAIIVGTALQIWLLLLVVVSESMLETFWLRFRLMLMLRCDFSEVVKNLKHIVSYCNNPGSEGHELDEKSTWRAIWDHLEGHF